MKPQNWNELGDNEKREQAMALANSSRARFLLQSALSQAAVIARGVDQISNAEELDMLAEALFPLGDESLKNVELSCIEPSDDDHADAPKRQEEATDTTAVDFTIRDEANALISWAFRNGPIENLHAGRYSELLEVDSLIRITDNEMKAIMLNARSQLAS